MELREVFDRTSKFGGFARHMSDFGHMFLQSDEQYELIETEPTQYRDIPRRHYIQAACFAHFWGDVLLIGVPQWVHKDFYRYENKTYEYANLKQQLDILTPYQFKKHNLYIQSKAVVYI